VRERELKERKAIVLVKTRKAKNGYKFVFFSAEDTTVVTLLLPNSKSDLTEARSPSETQIDQSINQPIRPKKHLSFRPKNIFLSPREIFNRGKISHTPCIESKTH